MNCATVFCLLRIYFSIASKTASYIAAAAEMYSYFISFRIRDILPVNRRTTCSWNPPRTQLMRGITNQVSAPKSITDWTIDSKEKPDTRGAALPADNPHQPPPQHPRLIQVSDYRQPVTFRR